jgi:predicted DNA-binding transcriptional regulator YafY
MFTAEEASALSMGGKLVEHLTDASLRKQMESAFSKIRSVLPRDRHDYLERLERSMAVVTPGAKAVPRLSGEALIPIQRALAERRVLALDYLGGQRQEVTKRHVEPLGLVYYADNWHLIAHCRLRRDVRDFRTDRILRLELQKEIFSGHNDFSLARHLEAERHGGDFELATIRFQPGAMERVRRERYWGLVEELAGREGVAVTLLDCSLEWLAGWVLSFGSMAEVLEPQRLRKLVAFEAEKITTKYRGPAVPLPLVSFDGDKAGGRRVRRAVHLAKVS